MFVGWFLRHGVALVELLPSPLLFPVPFSRFLCVLKNCFHQFYLSVFQLFLSVKGVSDFLEALFYVFPFPLLLFRSVPFALPFPKLIITRGVTFVFSSIFLFFCRFLESSPLFLRISRRSARRGTRIRFEAFFYNDIMWQPHLVLVPQYTETSDKTNDEPSKV